MQEDQAGLKIAVLLKPVPEMGAVSIDLATQAAVVPDGRVMNSYDVYAVSEAIGIKERFGGSVTVLAAGPPAVREILLRAMATGADDAVQIELPQHNDLDSLALARVLARELADGAFDLVLAGQSTDDYESGQVGPQVAEVLGWPHVSLVTHVEADGRDLRVHRDAEASKEVIGVPLPAVLMVLSGREGEQRYPTLRGMIAAKKKPLRTVTVPDIDIDIDAGRLAWTAPVHVERPATGTILEGMPSDEAAAQLVAWLKERRLV